MEELIKRDQKGIYSGAIKGEIKNVVGVDIHFDKPEQCDVIITNSAKDQLQAKSDQILKFLKLV